MFLDLKVFALAIMVLLVGSVICPPPLHPSTPTPDESCLNNCPITADYSPFCGTDNKTYATHGFLTCFQRCHIPISVAYNGKCSYEKPDPTVRIPLAKTTPHSPGAHPPTSNESCLKNCPVTADYTPFCGSDNQTHVTHGLLTCYQRCNIPITVAYEGRCSWDTPDPTIRIPVADPTSTIKTPVA